MTFIIDTGGSTAAPAAAAWGRIDRCGVIMIGVMDGLPPDPPQHSIDAAIVGAVLGELHKPKLLETVRERLLSMWSIIAPLAATDPTGFDEILSAYAELTTWLPASQSEAIAQRKASAQPR